MKPGYASTSASWFGALFFPLMFTSGSAAEVMQPGASSAEIGISALRFSYAEFRNDGSTFDKELGSVPGLSLRFAQRFSAWEWGGTASYHYGRADYTGQTQSGVPYNTLTDEAIGDVALRLGRWFGGNYRIMPYAGLGYRHWDRDIRPASLAGLSESYNWKYVWLGATFAGYQQGVSDFTLDIGWIKPIRPVMYVGAYNARLNPESRDGVRLIQASRIALSGNTMLVLEPYFEFWQLGRSPSVTSGMVTLYEPASETRNFGFNLRLGRMF